MVINDPLLDSHFAIADITPEGVADYYELCSVPWM